VILCFPVHSMERVPAGRDGNEKRPMAAFLRRKILNQVL
jgi:hypothetical protein